MQGLSVIRYLNAIAANENRTPVPSEDTDPLFGSEFTKRDHPWGMGVQWIGTVGGFVCSIIWGTDGILIPAGTYELHYKTGTGDPVTINSPDPAGIIDHLDKIRVSIGTLEHLDKMREDTEDNS